MQRFAAFLFILSLLVGVAAIGAPLYAGVAASTGGASANTALKSGTKYWVQPDAAVRFRCGAGSGTAVSNTPGSTYGVALDSGNLFKFDTSNTETYCACLPQTGTAAANCYFYERNE